MQFSVHIQIKNVVLVVSCHDQVASCSEVNHTLKCWVADDTMAPVLVGWLVGWLVFHWIPFFSGVTKGVHGGGGGGCASQIWLDWQSYYLKYCTKRLRSTRISIWEPKIQTLTSRFTPGPEARILRSLALSCQNVPPKCRSGHAIDTITLTNMAALHLSS